MTTGFTIRLDIGWEHIAVVGSNSADGTYVSNVSSLRPINPFIATMSAVCQGLATREDNT
jgi:hypothetical protein